MNIPKFLQHLKIDHRGYPIPYIALIDKKGKPHFTINDERKVAECHAFRLCGICGKKLNRGMWLVGGPLSAFHPKGCYADPPLHYDCMQYALQTCPYLAKDTYVREIRDKTLKKEDWPDHCMDLKDIGVVPGQPSVTVCVMVLRVARSVMGYFVPYKGNRTNIYRNVEYWKAGNKLPTEIGEALADVELKKHIEDNYDQYVKAARL